MHPLVRHLIYTTTSTTEQLAPSPAATAMEDMSTGDLQLTVENFPDEATVSSSEFGEDVEDDEEARNMNIIHCLKEELKECLLRRFHNMLHDSSYKLSAFLDPRFKSRYSDMPEIIAYAIHVEASDTDASAAGTDSSQSSVVHPASQDRPTTESITLTQTQPQKRSFWKAVEDANHADLAQKRNRQSSEESENEMDIRCNAELACYKSEDPLMTGGNVFTFWKERQAKLPLLSGLANKFLSIPASSVPSERIFSAAGLIISARRSCLKPSNADKLIFLNKNWKL